VWAVQDGRWIEVSPSQFDHEKQGLAMVKALLPDAAPFRAWSNFEFRDSRGRWHEVDLLVLSRDTLYLIELKYYNGTLRGNDHVWTRDGHRSEDSPLLLARRKAQYFSSLLKDRLAKAVGSKVNQQRVIPYVQELVFLHHPGMRCELPDSSKKGLYGLPGSGLPSISEALLAAPKHEPVSEERSLLIRDLMVKVGLVPRRQREVGSWVIDEEPLSDGDGWQDWPAFHHVDTEQHARIRFYLPKPGATAAEEHARVRGIEHEYRLLKRLKHDGLQVPADVVKDKEMGIGLVFDQPKEYTRLDLWFADHKAELSLDEQLELLSQLAAIVQYAHRHRVVHRALSPHTVSVRQRGAQRHQLVPLITDWDSAGVLPANSETGITKLSAGPLSATAGDSTELARLFTAPEGRAPNNLACVDVFGLGALAFYLITGGIAPATERGDLIERLRRDQGLDLAAEMPQAPSLLRALVLAATNPSPAKRIGTVADFLAQLDDTRRQLVGSAGRTDPLEAGPGTELDGRFVYQRRLGAGSTAVGILVTDHKAGGAQRVLKVAKDDAAANRLHAEAHTLGRLHHERIVSLHSKETVGGRQALVLQYAGGSTLAEELTSKGRLSIDLLERWGTDLLSAVVALEREGVTHRDIKPANLGVWASSQRADSHLVMFDFSMAGVDPRDTEAGTPPYLDPFLGLPQRRQYDSSAERYGAAVVLFEMATGRTPQYGPDPQAHPATVDAEVSVESDYFESAVATALTRFFAAALSRSTAERPDTAEDMLREWKGVFTSLDAAPTRLDATTASANATATTALTDAGLSARAVSALVPVQVTTVGELLALDAAKLNRLVGKETKPTRGEIKERYRQWRDRLGVQRSTVHGPLLQRLDEAVQVLLAAVGRGRASTKRQAAMLLLGQRPGLEAFASGLELAAALDKAPQRGHQLIKELQSDWAAVPAARELLDAVLEIAQQVLRDSGGVVAVGTLTSEVRALFPESPASGSDAVAPVVANRAAAGLLRVAIDRLTEHEDAEGGRRLVRRRHDGRLALLATDEVLLAAAESAARRADELVAATPETVISAARAARELGGVFTKAYRGASEPGTRAPIPEGPRLVRLAAAISRSAAVSGRGELHSRFLSPTQALQLALAGLAQTEGLDAAEIRARVAARFPELDRLPGRPMLDGFVDRAGLGLRWAESRYRFPDAKPPSVSTLHTRASSVTGHAPRTDDENTLAEIAGATRASLLRQSRDEYGFLAIGVTVRRPDDHTKAATALADTYDGDIVDVTDEIITAMREFSERQGVPWDLVRSADAAGATPRDARGLRAVLDAVVPKVTAGLDTRIFDGDGSPRPLILTELSPLARFGFLETIARWSDLTAARRRPVWAVLPQMRQQRGAQVDGKPVQLGAPGGQFVTWQQDAKVT